MSPRDGIDESFPGVIPGDGVEDGPGGGFYSANVMPTRPGTIPVDHRFFPEVVQRAFDDSENDRIRVESAFADVRGYVDGVGLTSFLSRVAPRTAQTVNVEVLWDDPGYAADDPRSRFVVDTGGGFYRMKSGEAGIYLVQLNFGAGPQAFDYKIYGIILPSIGATGSDVYMTSLGASGNANVELSTVITLPQDFEIRTEIYTENAGGNPVSCSGFDASITMLNRT